MSIRGIKIELTGGQIPYRGTTKTAIIDFEPEEIAGDGWGAAPVESTVRNVFRTLVHGAAVDEPENALQARITACDPVAGTVRPQRGSSTQIQATRWRVTSHTPYAD